MFLPGCLQVATIPLSQEEYSDFSLLPGFPPSRQHISLNIELCQDCPSVQSRLLSECGGRTLLYPVEDKSTIRRPRSKKWQATCFMRSEFAQLCLTLCSPCYSMDCSLPGSSVHQIFQARVLEWSCHFLLQGNFPTQGSKPGLPHCKQTLYPMSHQGSPQDSLKSQLLTKAVLEFNSRMSLLCFSGRLDVANTQVSQGEMTTFARQTPNSSAQKDVSLQFQSYVIAFLEHNVLSVNLDFCICFNCD